MSNDSSRMKIAYFAGSMKPGIDGVARVLYKTSEKLRERGVDHIFFSASVPHRWEQPVTMYQVPSLPVPFYRQYRLSLFADFQVNAVLAKYKPDIMCVNSPCSLGWAAIYYAKAKRIPIVAYYHTHFVSYAQYYKVDVLTDLGWHYMSMFYGNMQRTFVPSQAIIDELASHGLRNLKLLPHGVDTALFSSRFASADWKERIGARGKTVLLFVGRLVWEKDLATLAAAWRIIREREPDARLVLVGDGPIRKDLEKLLPDAIFLGYKTGAELSACYASSDIFVFPSTTETFGMVTTEAMASGLVPVCADAGGASGIIRHGETGFLAPPRDAEQLARCCLDLLGDPEKRLRMGQAAQAYAASQSWDAIVDRMLDEYAEVISESRSRAGAKKERKGKKRVKGN